MNAHRQKTMNMTTTLPASTTSAPFDLEEARAQYPNDPAFVAALATIAEQREALEVYGRMLDDPEELEFLLTMARFEARSKA